MRKSTKRSELGRHHMLCDLGVQPRDGVVYEAHPRVDEQLAEHRLGLERAIEISLEQRAMSESQTASNGSLRVRHVRSDEPEKRPKMGVGSVAIGDEMASCVLPSIRFFLSNLMLARAVVADHVSDDPRFQ